MDKTTQIEGACHCGAVRYRAPAPTLPATLCHCASCRRTVVAPVIGLFTVLRDGISFAGRKPAEYRSSPEVIRGFCAQYGTSLTYWHAGWKEDLSVTLASLDDPALVIPSSHSGMADALSWDVPGNSLPRTLSVSPA